MKRFLALFALFAASLAVADKPTLAITPIQVSTELQNESSAETAALPEIVSSLQGKLGSAFGQTGKFTVISRTDLKPILDEQTLGQSGNIDPNSAAEQGKLSGAAYVLVVHVSGFSAVQEEAHFSSIDRDLRRNIVYLYTISNLYNASTGALIASSTDSIDSGKTDNYFSYVSREGNLDDVLFSEVAGQMAKKIATRITADLFPPKVVAKTGKQITINQGLSHGFNPGGDDMSIYAVGEEMIDPDTGESLGQEEVFIGTATMLRQDERLTIALLNEDNGVERGQIVRVKE